MRAYLCITKYLFRPLIFRKHIYMFRIYSHCSDNVFVLIFTVSKMFFVWGRMYCSQNEFILCMKRYLCLHHFEHAFMCENLCMRRCLYIHENLYLCMRTYLCMITNLCMKRTYVWERIYVWLNVYVCGNVFVCENEFMCD